MGLIDVLTQYDTKKKAAHAAKTVKHGVSLSRGGWWERETYSVYRCLLWTHGTDDISAVCVAGWCRDLNRPPRAVCQTIPRLHHKHICIAFNCELLSILQPDQADIICKHWSEARDRQDRFHCSNIIYYFWCFYLFLRFEGYNKKVGGFIEATCCLSLFSVPQCRSNMIPSSLSSSTIMNPTF